MKALPLQEAERLHREAIEREAMGSRQRKRWLLYRFFKEGMEDVPQMKNEKKIVSRRRRAT